MSNNKLKGQTRDVQVSTPSGIWTFVVNANLSESEIEKTKFLIKTWVTKNIPPNHKKLKRKEAALAELAHSLSTTIPDLSLKH